VAAVVLGSARSKVAAACLYAGGFVLFVCLIVPLEGVLLSRPIYNVGEAGIAALVTAAVVTVGCVLAGNPRRTAILVFGLVISETLMLAGVGVILYLAVHDPKRLLGTRSAIAVLLATGGFLMAKLMGRRGKSEANVR
jgi:CHASE2 domain-containing sensor protein